MQFSAFLVATGAVLTAASPVQFYKKDVVVVNEIDTVTNVMVVTVTDAPAATPTEQPVVTTVPVVVVTVTDGYVAPETTPVPTPVETPAVKVFSAPVAAQAAPVRVALSTPTDFASTATYHHNIHRFNNSAGALTYDDNIANSAAVLAATCNFHHDTTIGGGGYGQNIAMWASSSNPQALGAANAIAAATSDMWYNGEVGLFPVSGYGQATPDMSNFEAWGHYSQLVWKATERVGCAAQYCAPGTMNPSMGAWFTVCNYGPAGNVGGQYGGNVGQPLGEATVAVNN